jgi:hypothetical protein
MGDSVLCALSIKEITKTFTSTKRVQRGSAVGSRVQVPSVGPSSGGELPWILRLGCIGGAQVSAGVCARGAWHDEHRLLLPATKGTWPGRCTKHMARAHRASQPWPRAGGSVAVPWAAAVSCASCTSAVPADLQGLSAACRPGWRGQDERVEQADDRRGGLLDVL